MDEDGGMRDAMGDGGGAFRLFQDILRGRWLAEGSPSLQYDVRRDSVETHKRCL
jgi:hypothetical protein